MEKPAWLEGRNFFPVVRLPSHYYIHDFTQGDDPLPEGQDYSVGRYNENRKSLYKSPLFTRDKRTIHMGVDIAAPAGESVYSFYEGRVLFLFNHSAEGDYGPTVIMEHSFNGNFLYSLYGHLNRESIADKQVGQKIAAGEVIGRIGNQQVNGGWFPHLHFQLSLTKPTKPDMPGVVSVDDHSLALQTYPDPRWVLGPLYND